MLQQKKMEIPTENIELFLQLEDLVATNASFESKVIELEGCFYKTYNYRIASYSDFLLPGALEARGIMFEVDSGNRPLRLVSRPFKKFFNYLENPFTLTPDFSKIKAIYDKADGTMISTFIHKGQIKFKTRKTIDADQIRAVEAYLKLNPRLQEFLDVFAWRYTIIMEWTAPDNRIVLEYKQPELVILGMRNTEYGEELDIDIFRGGLFGSYLVKTVGPHKHKDDWLTNTLPKLEDIEGCVVLFVDGLRIKFKTEWYCLRHGTIDIVLTPKRLFEALLDEKYDELISINKDIPYLVDKIEKMYQIVRHYLTDMVQDVDIAWNMHKGLDRKNYAITIKGQKYFSLMMCKYLGQDIDYKKAMINLWKDKISKDFAEKEYMGAE